MPKQLNVNLAFTADTSQAKAQLQQLQNQLTQLTNTSLGKTKDLGLVKDIQDATAAAAQLKVQLESATNATTGKLDLGKFNDSLKHSGTTLADYKTQLEKLGPEGSQAFLSLAQSISNAEMPLRRSNALVKEFGVTLMNAARWQFSSSVLHGLMGAMQGAYGYAQDLNRSLTDIAIVTGNSVDNMAAFAEQANKSAQALSTSTLAYTDAALIYYQQGLNDEEVQARTETTLKMSNVTRQSAEEVSSYMTAIWNNFYDGSESLESFADKITALGAATASSSEEIATGLGQFASLGSSLGLNYDDAVAALATVVAQTRQSASTVGNSFRTLFQRIESLKLGDTLEDGVGLTKYSEALAKVGVQVLDVNGEMRDMSEVIQELGAKWQTLSKAQQNALAQTVGGVRNSNTLIAWMDNFDKFQENLGIAANAEGALQEQADIYAESWEAAQKRVQAAWQAIYQDLINDKFFITILNGVEKVLQGIDSLIDRIGGLKGVITTAAFALSVLLEDQIAKGLENAAYNIKMMTSAGQQELKDKKTEAWDLASQINVDKGSAEGEAMTTNLQNTAILQKTLYENAQRMSDEEVKINQLLIDGNKALQERNVEAAKAVDLAEEETLKRREALQRSSREEDGYNTADFSKGMALIDGFVLNMSEKKAQMKDIWSTEELDQYNDAYIKNIEKVSEEYHISTNALWEYVAAKEAEAEKNRILTEAQQALADSQTSLTERFKAGGIILQSMSTDIVRVAQSITGIIQIFRNIGSIVETITAPDLSPWEKFVKVLGVVAMTIPMITRTFSTKNIESAKNTVITLANTIAIKKNTQANLENAASNATNAASNMADAAASTADTVAKTAEAGATKAAAGATMEFGAAIATLMPWILGISAAIVGIVGIIKLFDAAIYTADERLADANEKLKESQAALQQANTAATEATQAYNELSKTLDSWDEKRAGIDELTKGTLEFKQAVADANTELIQTLDSAGMLGNEDIKILYDKNNVAYLSPEDVSKVMQASMEQAMTAATAQTIARIQVEEDKYQTAVANSLKQIQDSAQVSYQAKQISNSQNTADANMAWEKIGGNYFTGQSDEEIVSTIEEWAQKISDAGYTSADLTKQVIQHTDKLSFLEDIADDSDILSAIGEVVDAVQTKDITSDAYKADLGQQAALNSGVNIDYLPDDMKQDFFTLLGSELLGGEDFGTKAKEYEVSDNDKMAYADEFGLKWDQVEQQWLDAQGRVIDDVSESYVQQWAYAKYLMSGANEDVINKVAEDYRQKVQQGIFTDVGMNADSRYARGWGQDSEAETEFQDAINNATDEQLKIYASIEWTGGESPEEALQKLKEAEAEEHHIAIDISTDNLTHFKGKEEELQQEIGELTEFIQEHAESLDELDDHLADCEEGAKRVATAIIRFDDAIQDVTDNYEDWSKALNGDDYQSKVKALKELRTAYGNLMDIDPKALSALSEEFLSDPENLDLMKDAINDVDGAYEQLQQKMGQQILADIGIDTSHWDYDRQWIEDSVQQLTGQDWDDIEVGADLNDADFLQGLTDMVNAAGMSADQATAYLASMGVDATVVEDDSNATETSKYTGARAEVDSDSVEGTDPLTGEDKTYTVPSIRYVEDPMVTTSNKENKSFSLKVTAAEKSSGGGFKYEKSSHGGGGNGGKGGSKKSCFASGTLITTNHNYKNIEDIKIGDIVLSYNEKTKKNEYSKVLQTMIHNVYEKIYSLFVKDDKLKVTGNHRFLVIHNNEQKWIEAADLQVGDLVLFADGTLHQISKIDTQLRFMTVYNFEVSNTHNYYVGENQILAHNKGGSKGSKPKKKKTEKPKDKKENVKEKDRYHNIKEAVEDLNTEMDRLNKNKDRAYGKQRLKYMDDEIKKTKDQIGLTKKYIAEIQKYAKEDKKALKDKLKEIGMTDKQINAQFDANGILKDYEGLLEAIQDKFDKTATADLNKAIDKYNEAVKTFNASDQGDAATEAFDKAKEELDAAQELYDKRKDAYDKQLKALDQYEDTMNLMQEKQQELLDQQNSLFDKALELVSKKIELKINIADNEQKYLEWVYDNIGDSADRAADRIANLGKQAQSSAKKVQANAEGLRDMLSKVTESYKGQVDFSDINMTLDINDPKAMLTTINQVIEKMQSKGLEAPVEDIVNLMNDYRDALMEEYNNLRDINEQVTENMVSSFEDMMDSLNENLDKNDGFQSLMDHYKEIRDLLGQEQLGLSDEEMRKWDQQMLDIKRDAAQVAQANYIAAHDAAERARKEYEEAIKSGNQFRIDRAKEVLKTTEEAEKAAQDEALTRLEETLQKAKEMYEQALEDNEKAYQRSLGGGILPTLDKLQDQFDMQKEINDLHLDDYEKYKKLGDLQANINKQLANNPNVKVQGKLKDLMDDVNDKMAAGAEISEGEATILEKRLQLLQAEDQLMAARNAKSAVRMTRDNEGNFSYTYTADTSKIEEAQQNYADKFYDLLDYERQYSEDTQAAILQSYKEFLDKRNDIINDESLTQSEKEALLRQLEKDMKAKVEFYTNEMEMVTGEMGRLRDEDWADMEKTLGRMLAAPDDFETKFEDTTLGKMAPAWKDAKDGLEGFVKAAKTLTDADLGAYGKWIQENEISMQNVGSSTAEYGEKLSGIYENLKTKSTEAKDAAKGMAEQMQKDFPEILKKGEEFDRDFSGYLSNITTNLENVVKAINDVTAALSGVDKKWNLQDLLSQALGKNANPKDSEILDEDPTAGFDTGGYTGKWGSTNGKLAVLHQKEIVLNEDDTSNMLKAVDIVRSISNAINLNNAINPNMFSNIIDYSKLAAAGATDLQQQVHIEASFPNVQSHNEIELAFNNLINSASQYVNRKR